MRSDSRYTANVRGDRFRTDSISEETVEDEDEYEYEHEHEHEHEHEKEHEKE
jgi:hypothetical protein